MIYGEGNAALEDNFRVKTKFRQQATVQPQAAWECVGFVSVGRFSMCTASISKRTVPQWPDRWSKLNCLKSH